MKYYSQYKQDEFIDFILRKSNGVFIDIGANDGKTYSNSYHFEKQKGWSGICIEPIPETFEKLISIRNCTCLNYGVWSEKKRLKFYKAVGYAEMLSGIVDSFHSNHFLRLKNDVENFGGSIETTEIEVDSLNHILEMNKIHVIDFISIDTEGSEYEILSATDFNSNTIKTIAVENQHDEYKIRDFLKTKNYKHVYRLGGDDIFIHHSIYAKPLIRLRIFLYKLKVKLGRFRFIKVNT